MENMCKHKSCNYVDLFVIITLTMLKTWMYSCGNYIDFLTLTMMCSCGDLINWLTYDLVPEGVQEKRTEVLENKVDRVWVSNAFFEWTHVKSSTSEGRRQCCSSFLRNLTFTVLVWFVQNIRYLVGMWDVTTISNDRENILQILCKTSLKKKRVSLCSANAWIRTHSMFPVIPKRCCRFSVVQSFQFEFATHLTYIQGKHSRSIDRKYNCRESWCYIIRIKQCFSRTNQWLVFHVLAICL